jgi:hypothetical protein
MCDEDVVHRVSKIFGVSMFRCGTAKPHHKPSFQTSLRGQPAVTLMLQLRELMGSRRRAQIDKAVASARILPKYKISPQQIEVITRRRAAGERAEDLAREYGVSKWGIYALKRR